MPSKLEKKVSDTKSNSSRSRVVIYSGYLFIGVNFLLGIINILVGIISHSIAISSDAIHSFIDSISGFIIIIGENLARSRKLSSQRAFIERITTIIIATIIIVTGVHIIIESITSLLENETPDFSVPTIIVLIVSIALKYLLAHWLKVTGKSQNSTVLSASGAETMNDMWISVSVLISTIIYLIWQVNLESYISIAIAFVIIKVGLEFIFPHFSHHHHHHFESTTEHQLKK